MKQLTFLFAVLLSMVSIKSFAHDIAVANSDGKTIYYIYTNNNTELAVSYCSNNSNKYSGDVAIPESVTYNGKTYSVTSIYGGAFQDCTSLTSVTIPNSVTSIDQYAFYNCTSLTSITIPNSVTSIGGAAFCNCSNLTSIIVESGNKVYDSRGNCNAIIETSTNTLIAGCKNTIIPNSVTSIGQYAFSGCTGLASITIPNSVTSIGDYAFYGCSGLTSVTIPNSVTSIGDYAFQNCFGLIEPVYNSKIFVFLPRSFQGEFDILMGIKIIAGGAFKGCTGLTAVDFPEGMMTIGDEAFRGCTGLTAVDFPEGMMTIGDYAFRDCSSLTSITIPQSVNEIGLSAFGDCNLSHIYISDLEAWCKITFDRYGPYIGFNINKNTLHIYLNGVEIRDLVIPSGVTSIGGYKFFRCSALNSVAIPNSVTTIGGAAFRGCSGLTSVTIPNSVTVIGGGAFNECTGLTSVTIGSSVTEIDICAFEKCTALKRINCLSKNVPTIPPDTHNRSPFEKTDLSKITLYVPASALANYKAKSPWSEFGKILSLTSLSMKKQKGKKGTQIILPIALNNNEKITGLQFDLHLPAGVTVATKSNGRMKIETTERMKGTYTISSYQKDGFVRVLGYSTDGDTFTGSSGDILNVTLDIDESMAEGSYNISLKDVVLSNVNNIECPSEDVDATLMVTNYVPADVDGSCTVNINDVVCIINYILGKTVNNFNADAADVDENGAVNINDVVTLINRYILNKASAPVMLARTRLAQRAASVADNYLYMADMTINPGETKEVQLLMTNTGTVAATQGNIRLPAGLSFVTKSNDKADVRNINDRSEDFTLLCQIQKDGSLSFAHYSGDGFSYEGNTGGIFTFKIKADETATAGTYSVTLSNVVLSIDGVGYDIPDRTSSLTVTGTNGISNVNVNVNENDNNYYTLDGHQLQGEPTQKGVYIVNGRKVVIK
jgi:hypothetical protein